MKIIFNFKDNETFINERFVQIAENCTYSATSFPEDCVISFYK